MTLNIGQVRAEAERLPDEFQEQTESLIDVWGATVMIEDELRDLFCYTEAIAVIPGGKPIVNELASAYQHLIKVNELCEKLNKQIIEKGKLQNKKQARALAALVAGAVEYMNILEEKSNGS